MAIMAPLEQLSPELWLMVFGQMTDMADLYSLVCASPITKGVFDSYATGIVNKAIIDTIQEELHECPRWIAVASSVATKTSPFAAETTQEFLDKYHVVVRANNNTENIPVLLPGLVGTPGPRKVLLAAYRADILTGICLAEMLARLHSLEAGHQSSPHFFVSDGSMEGPGPHNIIEVPQESFSLPAAWDPSWVEMTRVRHAVWQTIAGYATGAIPGIPEMGVLRDNQQEWAAALRFLSVQSLSDSGILVGASARGYQRGDTYDCVNDTLSEVLGCPLSALLAGQGDKLVHERAVETIRTLAVQGGGHANEPDNTADGNRMGRSRRHASLPNYGMSFYVGRYRWTRTSGPLTRQDFRIVSRLGLAVWDTERLRALGLSQPPGNEPFPFALPDFEQHYDSSAGRQLAAWRSVILQEMNRLHGTAFGAAVMAEEYFWYTNPWNLDSIIGDWRPIQDEIWQSRPFEGEHIYRCPLEREEDRPAHTGVTMDLVAVMRAVLDEYHGQPQVAAEQGGQDGADIV